VASAADPGTVHQAHAPHVPHQVNKQKEQRVKIQPAYYLAIGLVLGGLVGVLLDNIVLWAGAGLVLGAALAAAARRPQG
jgi:uncharacterized membrane protein